MSNLPVTQPYLHSHADESSEADTGTVSHGRRAKAELALCDRHIFYNLGKGVHVHGTTEQAFPEDDEEDNVDGRDEVEQGV